MIDLTPLHSVIDVRNHVRMADGIRVIGSGTTKIPFIGVELNTYVDFVYSDGMIHLYSIETDKTPSEEIACKQLRPADQSLRVESLYSSFMDIKEVHEDCEEFFSAEGRTKINIGDVPSGTNCIMAIVFDKSIVQLNNPDTGDLLAEVKIKLVLA